MQKLSDSLYRQRRVLVDSAWTTGSIKLFVIWVVVMEFYHGMNLGSYRIIGARRTARRTNVAGFLSLIF